MTKHSDIFGTAPSTNSKVIERATYLCNFNGWTGRSGIHCSFAVDQGIDTTDLMAVFKAAYKMHLATDVWRMLQHRFAAFEWLLSQQQFEDRAYVDWYAHAKLQGDTQESTKLVNPASGNVFHRVALHEGQKLVGGIRFWLDPGFGDTTDLGFRFRVQALEEESEKVRVRVLEQAVLDRERVGEIEVELASQPASPISAETEKEVEAKVVKLRELE